MKPNNKEKIMTLDGSPEVQKKSTERFLSLLTDEEIARSESDELAYLDEDLPT